MERRHSHLHPYLHFPGECCGGHFLTYSLCISKTLLSGAGYQQANPPKQFKPRAGYPRAAFGLEGSTSSHAHLVSRPCKASSMDWAGCFLSEVCLLVLD